MKPKRLTKRPIEINKKPVRKRTANDAPQLIPTRSTNVSLSSFNYDSNILKSIKHLLDIRWDPISMLNPDFQQHLIKYRNHIPKVILKTQLYSIHLNDHTKIDQQVVKLCQNGILLSINNDNIEIKGELLIEKVEYFKILDQFINDNKFDSNILQKFKVYLQEIQFSVINKNELYKKGFIEKDLNELIRIGFLKLIPLNESLISLSIPNYGFLINLLKISRLFILKILNGNKWKEIQLNDLKDKWNRYKLRFKSFKGLNIDWIIYCLIGMGQIELFETFQSKCIKMI